MVKGVKLEPSDLDGIGKPLGGPLQRITSRGKHRYRAEISLPPIPDQDMGRKIVSKLAANKKDQTDDR